MRNHVVIGVAVIAIGSGTSSAAFTIGAVDFGGGAVGTNGSPLIAVGGNIIALGSTDPVWQQNAGGITGYTFGAIEDNAMGSIGIGEPMGVSAVSISPPGGFGAASASIFGGVYARGPITTTDDDAFVARIAVSFGASLATSGGVVISVQGLSDPLESNLIIDESGVLGSTGLGDNRTDGANYQLDIRFQGSYPLGDVYDIFVFVPTPGTVAVFGMMGFIGCRRRNRAG